MAQLMLIDGMSADRARWELVAVMASSALAKTTLALASGGWRYGVTVGLGLLLMLIGASVGVGWWV